MSKCTYVRTCVTCIAYAHGHAEKSENKQNEVSGNWRIEGRMDGNIMRFKMISKWPEDDYFNDCQCVVLLKDTNRCVNGTWRGKGHFDRESRLRGGFEFTKGGRFQMKRVHV